jgi:FAD dependent oxidoreductase TIGR03364
MLKNRKYDLVIVGAGVLGTFCAYHALKKGKSVLLLEKEAQPHEASIRNFGQIIPSGESIENGFAWGRKSLKIYKELQEDSAISLTKNGSWYIASTESEMAVMEEMSKKFLALDYPSQLFTSSETISKNPVFNKNYVKGGLFFPEEASINPLLMVHQLRDYLIQHLGLHYQNFCPVIMVEKKRGIAMITTAKKQTFWGDHVIIASGQNTQYLLPEHYSSTELKICQLQMMRLVPQKKQFAANILTGLSLRRYNSFKSCPSFSELKTSDEERHLQSKGIHIVFKQAEDGSILLGNSHKYVSVNEEANLSFETNTEINELILKEAKKIASLESWNLEATWIGHYLEAKQEDVYTKTVDTVIHILNGMGGKGITISPGFTYSYIQKLFN